MPKLSSNYVPAEGPDNAKIMLVGEAPGSYEDAQLRPFVGPAGEQLNGVLASNGISRDACYVTNICKFRPYENDFNNARGTKELLAGLDELYADITRIKPNVVVALGAEPLYYLTGKQGITHYRGSILPCSLAPQLEHVKVIPTLHPATLLYDATNYPIFNIDIARIAEDAKFPEFKYPAHNYHINPTGFELSNLVSMALSCSVLACDIEAVKESSQIICVGFALSASLAFCISADHPEYYSVVGTLLASSVKKIFHFGSYDRTVLTLNGFECNNCDEDTIIQAHVICPELPKDLGFLTSVFTRMPYYKTEGRANLPGDAKAWGAKTDRDNVYIYNCKDCVATFAIWEAQSKIIAEDDDFVRTYGYRMEVLDCTIEMGLNGFQVDLERRDLLRNSLMSDYANSQIFLDILATEATKRPCKMLNVNSSKEMPELLYKELKLPEKKNYDRKKKTSSLTTDDDALVSLLTFTKGKLNDLTQAKAKHDWELKYNILKLIKKIRGIRKLLSSYIDIDLGPDNRARSLYKVTGTETGRLSTVKFIDGTGLNLATLPRESIEVKVGNA